MHPFPHLYEISMRVRPGETARLATGELPQIESAPPVEFGGPGDRWSPEGLFTAAIADCIILNFQGIAAMSKFSWTSLEGRTKAVLDRTEGKMRFTRFDTHAKLLVPGGGDIERAKKLLEKAEQTCLVANSLNAERHLSLEVISG